jgi:hypothetical protein
MNGANSRFKAEHLDVFAGIPFRVQGELGKSPAQWVAELGIDGVPEAKSLPQHALDRRQVRAICQDTLKPVLFGYICAMAWGYQEQGPRGYSGATKPWQNRNTIRTNLEKLRAGNFTRREAYNLFAVEARVGGLGPSYFTKLLYFFSPSIDFWIMDQWTAKSINLLTGVTVVRMSGSAPCSRNKGGNYQAYCEEVDELARLLGVCGDEVEQRLMSKGKPDPWPWRVHVVQHCDYNSQLVRSRYPHIPKKQL